MLSTIRRNFRKEVEDVRTAFSKKDVMVAIIGLTVIAIACYLNHNFI